jgi:hypothetical protein
MLLLGFSSERLLEATKVNELPVPKNGTGGSGFNALAKQWESSQKSALPRVVLSK